MIKLLILGVFYIFQKIKISCKYSDFGCYLQEIDVSF